MNRYLVFITLAIVSACGGAEESVAPDSTGAREGPTEIEMVTAMEAHYTAAILAHDALVQGDLDDFRARLAELDSLALPPSSPDTWKPFDAQLHDAAARAQNANDLGAAASAMAAVAVACGSCHQGTNGGPVYPAPPVGEESENTKAKMRGHERAVLMLWDGVTGPSDYAWREGSTALADTPIFGAASPGEARLHLLALEATLRGLGEAAKTTTALPDRATLYGRMLLTCGGCHQALGVKLPERDFSVTGTP